MDQKANYNELWSQAWMELQRLGPLTHTNHRLILKVLKPYLVDSARLLDVGCGNGALLDLLSRRFPALDLNGIEGSEQAVTRAPESVRDRIVIEDITSGFSLDGRSFDIVICSEVLEHLPDCRPALASIVSHLRRGGHVLITVPHSMRYWSRADEFAGHYCRFEYEDFLAELKRASLEPIRFFTWGFPISYLYYRIVSRLDPGKLMRPGYSPVKAAAANILYHAMRIDDLFTGKRWHQLIALARKP